MTINKQRALTGANIARKSSFKITKKRHCFPPDKSEHENRSLQT